MNGADSDPFGTSGLKHLDFVATKIVAIFIIIIITFHSKVGDKRWRCLLRHCTTNRKVAGSIPDGVIRISR